MKIVSLITVVALWRNWVFVDDKQFRLGDDGELHALPTKRKHGAEERPSVNPVTLVFGTIIVLLIGLVGGVALDRLTVSSMLSVAALRPPTPTVIDTSTPSPTSTPTPYPAIYVTLNVNQFTGYTVYWKRQLWENALHGTAKIVTETFDSEDVDNLGLPYLTGNGFLLTGASSAQILRGANSFGSGNYLHFRDFKAGLTITFPNDVAVSAFAYDFQSGEPWQVTFNNTQIDLPSGKKFMGIIFDKDTTHSLLFSGPASAQGGLSIDSLSILPVSNS